MRLIRFGEKGKEKPGLIKDGRIADLTNIFPGIPDICEKFFRQGWLARLSETEISDSQFYKMPDHGFSF